MSEEKSVDELTGVETTGHEWDGIQELNNPLPAWWRLIFWGTVIWSIGYWIVYPAWPLLSDYTRGWLGYSSRADVAAEIATAREAQAEQTAKLQTASLESIRTDPALLEFALAGGRSAFNVHCTQCHGSGAQGFRGFPNLNDDEWLWGGTLKDISYTITHGVRNEIDDQARSSAMPAFLTDNILTKNQISDVASYVLSLSGKTDDEAAAKRGAGIFKENCVACHSEGGKGNPEFGAPALNNAIWLYGGDKDTIIETVSRSRRGVMPAWGRILEPVTVKKLAIYVHSLGGGK